MRSSPQSLAIIVSAHKKEYKLAEYRLLCCSMVLFCASYPPFFCRTRLNNRFSFSFANPLPLSPASFNLHFLTQKYTQMKMKKNQHVIFQAHWTAKKALFLCKILRNWCFYFSNDVFLDIYFFLSNHCIPHHKRLIYVQWWFSKNCTHFLALEGM